MKVIANEAAVTRLLRRLAARDAAVSPASRHRTASGSKQLDPEVLAAARARGLVEQDAAGRPSLTASGRLALRRALAGDGFAAQHQVREAIVIDGETALANLAESPLGWLRRRKGVDGRPLLDAAQFAAGERLRSDFTRGQLAPRVTSNWDAAGAGRHHGGGSGGIADLTETALAARLRVERAMAGVGPEFGGLLIDFCCFLKGIEQIERERNWPARSARLVLGLGLSALARHYGLASSGDGHERSAGIRHWGAADFRPR